jgi:flagellar hook assembly protein FlgD
MSEISGASSSTNIQTDYMKLLVTQLQNQNPLEPLDNNEMASQLSQFSQLQQLESINSKFAGVLAGIERTYANSLIGREISFFEETESGDQAVTHETVEQVYNDVDGQIVLTAGDHTVPLEEVISVKS